MGTLRYFDVLLGTWRYFWVPGGTFGYFEVLQGNFVHLNISGLSFRYLGDILRDSLTEFVQSAKCAKAGVKKSKRLVPVTFSLLVLDLLENSNSNVGARFYAFGAHFVHSRGPLC